MSREVYGGDYCRRWIMDETPPLALIDATQWMRRRLLRRIMGETPPISVRLLLGHVLIDDSADLLSGVRGVDVACIQEKREREREREHSVRSEE